VGPSDPADLGTVLGVWAHPDDETYLSAAHMHRAALAGRRVRCVTATRGELGSPDPDRWPPGAPLAAVRTRELEAALGRLGVTDHHWLDYPDGGCPDVPLDEAVDRLRAHIEAVRPDVVLTFGPDGMTGHADHQAVSRWVSAAVDRMDGAAPEVLWATNSPEWNEQWEPQLRAVGAFMVDGHRTPSTPVPDMRSYLALTDEEVDAKVEALLLMPSQIGPMVASFGMPALRVGWAQEGFRTRVRSEEEGSA
jgi:LmbE family N-acetylglucosaminyl deacetylase